MRRIAVIGAGAAGTFCAVQLSRALPGAGIDIYESGKRPLAKVAITGGGRCNLTNSFAGIKDISEAYPRGGRLMKRLLKEFSNNDVYNWFENEGVALLTQEDNCVFPVSQDAMEIVRTLLRGLGKNVEIHTEMPVRSILKADDLVLELGDGTMNHYDNVVVTTGGFPRNSGLLKNLELSIEDPVPSLFTFTIKDHVTEMMGTVVEATASIPGTKFKASGPLLVTDWGMSGPAILKLSSYAARYLAENQYKSPLSVNWINGNEEDARKLISRLSEGNEKKLARAVHPDCIPSRLWAYLLIKSGLREDIRWNETGKTGLNKLSNTLINDSYSIAGKTKFKEEFVTCGGVSLKEVNSGTLESLKYPGLYFAGEVLDIDAITGGFNLQAAWTTGYIVAKSIIRSI